MGVKGALAPLSGTQMATGREAVRGYSVYAGLVFLVTTQQKEKGVVESVHVEKSGQ